MRDPTTRLLPCLLLLACLPTRAEAKMSYHGGHLLTSPRYSLLLWGSFWADPSRAEDVAFLDEFLRTMAPSRDFSSSLFQYSVSGKHINPGSYAGYVIVDKNPPGSSIRDGLIDEFIEAQIDAHAVPSPDPQQVYIVLMPPGVTITNLTEKSNINFCGYHQASLTVRGMGNVQRRIVVAYPDQPACNYVAALNPPNPILANFTKTLSHEMAESVTNPDSRVANFGWADWLRSGDEIGDLCTDGQFVRQLGGYYVQEEWSSAAGACALLGPRASDPGGCPTGTHAEADDCYPDVESGCSVGRAREKPRRSSAIGLLMAAMAAARRLVRGARGERKG